LLGYEAAEFTAGGVQGTLRFLGIAAMDQRTALIVYEIEEYPLDSVHRFP